MEEQKLFSYESTINPVKNRVVDSTYRDEEIRKIVVESHLEDIFFWWTGPFLHSVFHNFKDLRSANKEYWDTSMLFIYYNSQAAQLEWLMCSFFNGQYSLVYRELRNLLENSFLNYRVDIDVNLRYKTIEEKFTIISDWQRDRYYGKKVFSRSGFQGWEEVYDFYGELSSYTHTQKSLESALEFYHEYDMNAAQQPYFDRDEALKCLECIKKVILIECQLMEEVLKRTYSTIIDYRDIFSGNNE